MQGNVEDPVIVTQKIAHPSGGSPITIFPSRLIFPQVDSARDGLTQVVTIQTHYDGDGNDAFIMIGHTVSYGDVKDIDLRRSASIWIEDVEAFGISVNPSTITITEGKSEGSAYWVNSDTTPLPLSIVSFTINGGDSANITKGDEVTLRWELNGDAAAEASRDLYYDDRSVLLETSTTEYRISPQRSGKIYLVVANPDDPSDDDVKTVIVALNEPPVAEDDRATVEQGGTIVIAVMDNDNDPDDDEMSVVVESTPSYGEATVIASKTDPDKIRYVHDGGEAISDSFTYSVRDGNGGTGTATVTIIVEPSGPALNHEKAKPATIKSGGSTTISWTPRYDVTAVYITGGGLTDEKVTGNSWEVTPPTAGETTYRLNPENEEGAKLGEFTVTITVTPPIENEKEQKAVKETVKAVAAATAANVAANIGTRFSAVRSGGTLVVGGQRVSFGPSPADWPIATDYDPFADSARVDRTRYLSLDELLRSSAFEMTLGAAEDGTQGGNGLARWTLWGRGDLQFFESDPERGSRYDGDLKAGYLGVEAWMGERWLAGVAGSRTMAEADYGLGEGGAEDGRLEMSLTSVHPYVRYALDARSEIWAFLGAGRGEIEIEPMGVGTTGEKSDVKMWMGSVGGRRTLKPAGAFKLALLGDWGFARVDTDDELRVVAFDQLTVDTWRARLGVEGSHTIEMESGGALTPFLEVAGRYDGGDGEDEGGIEISGGLSLADPAAGFGIEARGRWLAWHSAEDYSEHGVSVTASLSPRSDGTGLSLSVSPRWGAGTGGADALWREDALGRLGLGSTDAAALSLDTRAGYGVRAMRGLLTPFGELGLREHGGRRVRVGVRFDRAAPVLHDQFSLELSGERYESGRRAAPDHRVNLTSRLRF